MREKGTSSDNPIDNLESWRHPLPTCSDEVNQASHIFKQFKTFRMNNLTTTQLLTIEILSGNFATGDGNKGNFNAYDEDGQRYFIPKRLMEANGWSTDTAAAAAMPFYAKAKINVIGELDADGAIALNADKTPVTHERLQVMSIFKTREAVIASAVNKATLNIEIQAGINAVATSKGLTEANLLALANAAF